jgi:transcriptional regulator with XRE-family HTH domain
MRDWREIEGVAQHELARRIGTPQPMLALFESGERPMTRAAYEAIVRELACDPLVVKAMLGRSRLDSWSPPSAEPAEPEPEPPPPPPPARAAAVSREPKPAERKSGRRVYRKVEAENRSWPFSEREQLGLRQHQLAELCGVSNVTLGKYERGEVEPSQRMRAKIEAALREQEQQMRRAG